MAQILIITPDGARRTALGLAGLRAGHTITVVADWAAAAQSLARDRFDWLLTDRPPAGVGQLPVVGAPKPAGPQPAAA